MSKGTHKGDRGGNCRPFGYGLSCFPLKCVLAWLLFLFTSAQMLRAELQYDVFFGYDGMIHESNWFPVGFEIYNDGPAFKGTIELSSEGGSKGQVRRIPVELPTNTRKRIVVPAFASAGRYSRWEATLYDERGKKRAKVDSLSARKDIPWQGKLVGAIPRVFNAVPVLPELGRAAVDISIDVARMPPSFVPDDAISLEGLDAIYLNTERALELSATQGAALVSWVAAGGHLIVGVEQAGDLNGLPWLAPLMPVRFGATKLIHAGDAMQGFASYGAFSGGNPQDYRSTSQQIDRDDAFLSAQLPVFTATLTDGHPLLQSDGTTLAIQAMRGRGKITVLTFNPEREPFRYWKARKWFWCQLLEFPADWFRNENNNNPYHNYQSIDGAVGAMIDSKQVRKLPVSWLLLLLAVYLVVIGPFDHWWLKKINRQMLTWITFPCYVVGFSLLIYWIGFMLRAGETEWNELHIVDVLQGTQGTELRGRTYTSLYSPSNSRYPLKAEMQSATLRGEFQGTFGSQQEVSRSEIVQHPKGFEAEVFVPVWTSQLFVSDWLQPSPEPLALTVEKKGNAYLVRLENKTSLALEQSWLAVSDRIYELPKLAPGERREAKFDVYSGQRLEDFVRQNSGNFSIAADRRRNAFGDSRVDYLPTPARHMVALSFLRQSTGNTTPTYRGEFILPNGYELSDILKNGQACMLSWARDYSPVAPLNAFSPRRTTRETLFRITVPVP